MKVIIDADTGNEIDDLYAIARALKAPELDILGLCAAHYRVHDTAPADSAGVSHKLNRALLEKAQRTDIPACKGSNMWMGKAWGGTEPADSEAAQHIISSAHALSNGDTLSVIVQGALTNVASAIALQPAIAKKLDIYFIGFKYDVERNIWDKNDFNVRNDLNAADFLLNNADVKLHIMTSTTSRDYQYARTDTFAKLQGTGPLQDLLVHRWKEFAPDHPPRWIMWDLALVQAVIHPSLATTKMVLTPPENTQREVEIYDSIDRGAMMADFFRTLAE